MRIARISDGPDELVAFGGLNYRDDPEGHLVNVPTIGYVDMDLILLRSHDRGRTWEGPTIIDPPLVGPSWEVCHAIVELKDGRWIAPTSTWMGWNGDAPNGMNALFLVSEDKGRTWPSYVMEFDRWAANKISWEQSVIQLQDGRLLSVAWEVDKDTGVVGPTPYALSPDGRSFPVHGLTGSSARRPSCRAARRPRPRRVPAQRPAGPVGDHRPDRGRSLGQRGNRPAVAGRRIRDGRQEVARRGTRRPSSSASRRWSCGRTAT